MSDKPKIEPYDKPVAGSVRCKRDSFGAKVSSFQRYRILAPKQVRGIRLRELRLGQGVAAACP
jgi:hypothetical protein